MEQVSRRLTEVMKFADGKPVQHYKNRLLLLLDEFPALGRLDTFETALAYIAGYGMKALLIVQSINQLNKAYTQDNSIVDNCHIRICFTPNDDKTPEFISKLLGTKTEIVENKSYSGINKVFGQTTTSNQEISRPLLTPGEVSMLPKDEELVFVAGFPPIMALKLFYYQDNNFKKRLMGAPAISDTICSCTESKEATPQTGLSKVAEAAKVVEPAVLKKEKGSLKFSDTTVELKAVIGEEKSAEDTINFNAIKEFNKEN